MQVETSTGACILCLLKFLFTNGGKKSSKEKIRQLKLGTILGTPIPSKYLGPNEVSACWSFLFTAAVSAFHLCISFDSACVNERERVFFLQIFDQNFCFKL